MERDGWLRSPMTVLLVGRAGSPTDIRSQDAPSRGFHLETHDYRPRPRRGIRCRTKRACLWIRVNSLHRLTPSRIWTGMDFEETNRSWAAAELHPFDDLIVVER
jgi:hypothetical protein